jgi:TolB-like protein/cytochrome c-type biogenesis protein CcmH/NrfG
MSLFDELKRRNVIRVAAGYIVVAWLAIQVAETILPFYGVPDATIRLLITVLAVLFIPVVILAWVFEWTPEGIKVDSGVEQRGPRLAAAAKRWDRVVMAILVIAVAYFVVEKVISNVEAEPSIAVLPFVSTSADPEKAFYGAGVANEVLSLLARVPQVYVTSRTSSFAFAEQGLSIQEIADELGVDHILEGSVRQSGDRIRVTAQLIDTRTDRNLWSGTWERPTSDVFKIQDEIVADIVAQMNVTTSRPLPTSRRTDPAALALVLKAKQVYFNNYGDRPDPGTSERMRSLLEGALEIDPEYAPAMSWLTYADFFAVMERLIDREEWGARFNVLKDRVLAIDPDDPFMLQTLAFMALNGEGDFEAAARLYERALYHGPNESEVLRLVGKFAFVIGRLDESRALLQRAIRIDPLCTSCLSDMGTAYMRLGELDKGIAVRAQLQKLNSGRGRFNYGMMQLMKGNFTAATETFEQMGGNAGTYAGLAMTFHSAGDTDRSDEMVQLLEEQFGPGFQDPGVLAEVEAWRGNNDRAFQWLEHYFAEPELLLGDNTGNFGGVANLVGRPTFRGLNNDPRWKSFRERAGVPPERFAALDIDLTIPE